MIIGPLNLPAAADCMMAGRPGIASSWVAERRKPNLLSSIGWKVAITVMRRNCVDGSAEYVSPVHRVAKIGCAGTITRSEIVRTGVDITSPPRGSGSGSGYPMRLAA